MLASKSQSCSTSDGENQPFEETTVLEAMPRIALSINEQSLATHTSGLEV